MVTFLSRARAGEPPADPVQLVPIACHGHPASASFSASGSASAAALREFTLNGTDHASHHEQGSMIRCYIAWRNRNTNARTINRANVA